MEYKKHVLFLSVIAVCVGGFYYTESRKHHIVHKPGPPFAPVEAHRRFKNAAFIPVDSSNFWSRLELTFKQKAGAGSATNAPHADLLLQQVKGFIEAYSKGTFDAYLDFKSAGVPYDFTFAGGNLWEVARSITNGGNPMPTNTIEKAKTFWALGTRAGSNGVAPRITDISLDRLTVAAGKGSGPNRPTYWVATADSGAPQHICPGVVITKEALERIGKSETSEMYAVVGLACKVDHEPDFNKAHYLHLCFFWSEKYHRWLPLEMMDDYALDLPFKASITFPEAYSYPVFF